MIVHKNFLLYKPKSLSRLVQQKNSTKKVLLFCCHYHYTKINKNCISNPLKPKTLFSKDELRDNTQHIRVTVESLNTL